jgi:autotransporter strand-loop-strand O-heptosyltransferase
MIIHEQSISIYKDLKKSESHIFENKIQIRVNFDYSPKVVIDFGDFLREPYRIVMLQSDGSILHQSEITSGFFSLAYRRWIEDSTILVYDNLGVIVKRFNLFDKIKSGKVLVAIESSSLGDTLAWLPYVHKFCEKHKCENLTVTTFWNQLFEGQYSEFRLQNPGYREDGIDVLIGVGWYDESDRNHHKIDPRIIPLQKVASDILGLEYRGELKPKIKKDFILKSEHKKTVCMGMKSTAAAKHWNYTNGWQELIDKLVNCGYQIKVIQKQDVDLNNVINKTGDIDIFERIDDLLQCDFFIGVSSGLSWLAWSLDVPVVLISGFTKPFCEFSDKTLRIHNESVCNGCFNNINFKFDKGDWFWCPVHKNTDQHFICTKSIIPQEVFTKIMDWKDEFGTGVFRCDI